MACPTCDHTMQNLGVEQPQEPDCDAVFWCPRCGTVKCRKRGVPDDASFLLSVPFWMKKQPHIELVVCNDRIREVGDKGGDHAKWMGEFLQKEIESEVKKRLAPAVELRIREMNMGWK